MNSIELQMVSWKRINMDNSYQSTQQYYDSNADHYLERAQIANESSQIVQIEKFVSQLFGKRVLDAGCGGGRFIPEFLSRGIDLYAVDFSATTIQKLQPMYPKANLLAMNFMKLDFPDLYFDGIWACASVMHLKKKDLLLVLSEFKRTLKKRGSLFINLKEGIGEQLISEKNGQRLISFYTKEELKISLESAGFEITELKLVPDNELTGRKIVSKPNWIAVFARRL